MKKFLSVFLALSFLGFSLFCENALALYKLNPFTNKLDYYESGGTGTVSSVATDATLTGGTITTTGTLGIALNHANTWSAVQTFSASPTSSNGGSNNEAWGSGAVAGKVNNNGNVALGKTAAAGSTGNGNSNNIAIGYGATADSGSFAFGTNASSTAHTMVFGSSSTPYWDIYFPQGIATNGIGDNYCKIHASGGSGTDDNAMTLYLCGGQSTGNATGSNLTDLSDAIIFQTATAGSSGSTPNTLVNRMAISSVGDIYFGAGDNNSGMTSYTASSQSANLRGIDAESALSDNSNAGGGSINIIGGRGTGSGVPGTLNLKTSSTDTSVTTIQVVSNRLSIDGNGLIVIPGRIDSGQINATTLIAATKSSLGSENLTNGTFTGSASSWTLNTGWTYSSNTVLKSADGAGTLLQTSASMVTPLVPGYTYLLSYTISAWTVGTVTPACGGITLEAQSGNGTFTQVFIPTSTADLTFTPTDGGGNHARFTIDNISLKQITAGNVRAAGNILGNVVRTATAVSYTTLDSDYLIGVTSTASARTITLMSAAIAGAGKEYVIKDESGACTTNNITIATTGGQTIDGVSTYKLVDDYEAVKVYSNGSNWFVE